MSLKSANPFQEPIIDLNYFDQKDDVKTMIHGIRKVFSIFDSYEQDLDDIDRSF